MKKIGIVVAMEEEIAPFLLNKKTEVLKISNYTVYKIEISDKIVFTVKLFAAGEICAAAATQFLITQFSVELILNFGVVGALTEEISLHSALLVESIVHYDRDCSSFEGHPVGKYGCFPAVAVPTSADMLEIARKVAPQLPIVRCASGDKFVEGEEAKSKLRRDFNAEICDMESAGIVITATLNNVPVLLVKTVSDSLSGGGKEFKENLADAAEAYVDFVHKFLERI